MSARNETRAWVVQRASAAVLALCVAVHLATLVIAVHQGLSAAAILGRTRGSLGWMAFYTLFVIAVAIHAPLGLRTIAAEWLAWKGLMADIACTAIGIILLVLGIRAVAAVTL